LISQVIEKKRKYFCYIIGQQAPERMHLISGWKKEKVAVMHPCAG